MANHPLAATILAKVKAECEIAQRSYLLNAPNRLEYPRCGTARMKDPKAFLSAGEEMKVFGDSFSRDKTSNHYLHTCFMSSNGSSDKRQLYVKLAPQHATALGKNRTRIEDLTAMQISQLFPPAKVL
jgi:hypothetical protein